MRALSAASERTLLRRAGIGPYPDWRPRRAEAWVAEAETRLQRSAIRAANLASAVGYYDDAEDWAA